MEIVINKCHGGFELSEKAVLRYAELIGKKVWVEHRDLYNMYWTVPPEEWESQDDWWAWSLEERRQSNERIENKQLNLRYIKRNDSYLVQVVKELGKEASDKFSSLKIVEIPDDVDWEIGEYDGKEWVAEKHRIWS